MSDREEYRASPAGGVMDRKDQAVMTSRCRELNAGTEIHNASVIINLCYQDQGNSPSWNRSPGRRARKEKGLTRRKICVKGFCLSS